MTYFTNMKTITISEIDLKLLLNDAFKHGLNDTWPSVYYEWRDEEIEKFYLRGHKW